MTPKFTSAVFFIWAGLSVGGNILAAAAKFQVSTLTTAELLLVGRAQFAWLGNAEWILCATVLLLLAAGRQRPTPAHCLIILLLVLQQHWLTPLLQLRTDMIIAGNVPDGPALHFLFVGAEVAKLTLLMFAGLLQPDTQRKAQRLTWQLPRHPLNLKGCSVEKL
ncbi:hypothetical protein FEE96_07165 [Parasedimentitalea maritima]|uniref:Uncharacterized protein n=1 Tax=Parasedimentitalea maritima TaxID=2578117 RepID=A0ABY2UWX5_9RHOB|nr:hypothetical protein [Zongyanglinia marina]TLP67120.1 hypothetical protein FEE96_07165 [Zongyanglinia marina]